MNKPYIICHMMTSIDGRREMPSVFDGRTMEHPLTHLRLTGVQQFESGAVCSVKKVKMR